MPMYFRSEVPMTPSSIDKVPPEEDDDYIQDPDQLRDQLPQPFRLVDKLIGGVVDDAWEIIHNRETKRIADSSKIRPPQYECGIQMQTHGATTGMVDSKDGKYIILGLPDGLAVIDSTTQDTVTSWEEPGSQITSIHVASLPEEMYTLSTIDDKGVARLFCLAYEQLFLLQVLNEKHEGSTGSTATKCEASFDSEYVGVNISSSGTGGTLEVYKLPKDQWLKELESLHNQAAKQHSKTVSPPPVEDGETAAEPEPEQPSEDTLQVTPRLNPDDDARSVSPSSQRGGSVSGGMDKSSHKFSPAHVVLKVKAPEPLTGISVTSPYQASKAVNHGDVIGTGTNHLITTQHLEHRTATFRHTHNALLKYQPEEEAAVSQVASFHFLTAGRMLPHGLEQSALQGHTTTVAVWWSGGTQMAHYSLVKPAKDLEHKPDMVWPCASRITATAISPCSSLVAIALTSGNLVIWDKHLGMQRKIIHISKKAAITDLVFLDPRLCPQQNAEYPPYRRATAAYLMVTCDDGAILLVNSAQGDKSEPMMASPEMESEEEMYSRILTIPGIPQLVVACRQNGCVYVQDLLRGSVLCQVTLPADYSLCNPLHPVLAVGGSGDMLYMKAECPIVQKSPEPTEAPAEGEAEQAEHTEDKTEAQDMDDEDKMESSEADVSKEIEMESSIFAFQLRSFPTLDKYRQGDTEEIPYTVHCTVNDRIDALMKERISQQGLRKDRMQERWDNLKNDLEMIRQLQDHKKPSMGKKAYPLQEIILAD